MYSIMVHRFFTYITGASCHRLFMPIVQDAKIFATEFTVYNYDRRGRGDSGNTLPYTMEHEIEDIEAMIDVAAARRICMAIHQELC
jgi:hypothetical protein